MMPDINECAKIFIQNLSEMAADGITVNMKE